VKQWLLVTVLALSLTAGVAKADVITTFDVSGQFNVPSKGTFSGTLAVDVTAGTVSTVDITFPGLTDFTALISSSPFPPGWEIGVGNSGFVDFLLLDFTTTAPNSLIGFDGGTIFGDLVTENNLLFSQFSGSITRAVAPAPEPPSLALLAGGVGMLGLGLAWRRRASLRWCSRGGRPHLKGEGGGEA